MFPAEFLPELKSYLVATLPQLEHDHLTRHDEALLSSAINKVIFISLINAKLCTTNDMEVINKYMYDKFETHHKPEL